MKTFHWDTKTNQNLILTSGISFDDVIFFINKNGIIDDIAFDREKKRNDQKAFVVNINDVIHLVPYQETNNYFLLKSIIPVPVSEKESNTTKPEIVIDMNTTPPKA